MLFLLAWDYGFVGGSSLWLSWERIHLRWGRPGFDPWVGKIPQRREGYPLQYSGLENFMDSIAHGVAKSQTWLSDFHFHFHFMGLGGGRLQWWSVLFYHVIQSTCLIPGNVDLDHLAEVAFVRLFHCQVTLFLPLHIVVFFRMKSPCITHS